MTTNLRLESEPVFLKSILNFKLENHKNQLK